MPTVIVAAIGLTGAAAVVASALVSFAISYIASSLFAPDAPESPPDQGVSARIPTDPKNKLPVVYGEQRVAGQTTFADISSDNQTMYFVISLCEGPVEAITNVQWEDWMLTFDGDISTGLRGVTNATNSDMETSSFLNGNFRCRVFPAGGDPTELTFAKSSRWSNGRLNRTMPDTAYAYVELSYNREERVTGLPSRLFFNVKGRTIDLLQSDGTFSPFSTLMTQELRDAARSNPADCLIDYMTNERYGCGLGKGRTFAQGRYSDLDLPSFFNHKFFCDTPTPTEFNNFCTFETNAVTVNSGRTVAVGGYGESGYLPDDLADASVYNNERDCLEARAFRGDGSNTAVFGMWESTPTSTPSSILKQRYTTNGNLNTNSEMDRNISDLTVGNGASLTYNLGKFGLISEGNTAVAKRNGQDVQFSENNIIGKLDITGSGFDSVLNEATIKFTSPRQRYQQEQVRIAFADVGGGQLNTIQNPNEPRLEKTLQLPFTNNDVEARRVGTILINDSRQALIVSFQANIDNTDLQAGDIIQVSHDTPKWTNKLFRVQQVEERVVDQENSSIGVSIIAREYSSLVFSASTLLLQDPAPNTNLPNPLAPVPLTVTAIDASEVLVGTGLPLSQIRVDWSGTINQTFLDSVDVRYFKGTPEGAFGAGSTIDDIPNASWTYVATTSDNVLLTGLEDNEVYQIQLRSRNTLGAIGGYLPNGPDSSTWLSVLTKTLETLAPLTVVLTSDNSGTAFTSQTSTEKEVTSTAFVSGLKVPDELHTFFGYSWLQDGVRSCVSGSCSDGTSTFRSECIGNSGTWTDTNDVIGTADTSNQTSRKVCESTGGFWTLRVHEEQTVCETASGVWGPAETPPVGVVGVSACRLATDPQNMQFPIVTGSTQCSLSGTSTGTPHVYLGCSEGTLADTNLTTNDQNLRTITLGIEDVASASDITCNMSAVVQAGCLINGVFNSGITEESTCENTTGGVWYTI